MRIAISGSAGIGKTTLARQLAEYYKIPMIAEGVREYLREKGLTLQEARAQSLYDFQTAIWQRHSYLTQKYPDFIADRSFVDFLVYASYHISPEADWLPEYINKVASYAYAYDLIIILPFGNFPIVSDGTRKTNPLYQRDIHRSVIDTAERYAVTVCKITGKPDKYLELAVAAIDATMRQKSLTSELGKDERFLDSFSL